MKILIDVLHPAHVHFFRYIRKNLAKDYEVIVTARSKDVCINLLQELDIPYYPTTIAGQSPFALSKELIKRTILIDKIAQLEDIDLMLGISGTSIVPIGRIRSIPTFVFTDTEDAGLAGLISYPWATRLITPECFARDYGARHVRYNGYHELAYLHPAYYKPNPGNLAQMGLDESDTFFFLRFTSFSASHDVAHRGFTSKEKHDLVQLLAEHGTVIISSEGALPRDIDKLRFRGKYSNIHDFMYYSSLFIGDSQTMSTEAALLGTPSVRCNSLVDTKHGMGNFRELREDYEALYSIRNPKDAFSKIEELLLQSNLKEKWRQKRERIIAEKTNVVDFIVDYINKSDEI